MKFKGNPSDLGLNYHAFTELILNGESVVRYVLSDKITPEQEEELSQYDNIRLSKDGCYYKYAPEQKFDVIFIFIDKTGIEDLESSEESFEDEHLGAAEEDNSDEILSELDNEITDESFKDQLENNRFAHISSIINLVNNLSLMYRDLNISESSAEIDSFIEELAKQSSYLQNILVDKNTNTNIEGE